MAGHLALSKLDEPKIFGIVEKIKLQVINLNPLIKDFYKFYVNLPDKRCKQLSLMKLSRDYVENPQSEVAYTIGKFSLKSITDEHSSLTQKISLEVHFDFIKKEIKNIYWVA